MIVAGFCRNLARAGIRPWILATGMCHLAHVHSARSLHINSPLGGLLEIKVSLIHVDNEIRRTAALGTLRAKDVKEGQRINLDGLWEALCCVSSTAMHELVVVHETRDDHGTCMIGPFGELGLS